MRLQRRAKTVDLRNYARIRSCGRAARAPGTRLNHWSRASRPRGTRVGEPPAHPARLNHWSQVSRPRPRHARGSIILHFAIGVGDHLPPSTCNPQRATFNAQPSTCNLQRATLNAQPSTCNLPRATFNVQPSTRNLQRATFNVQPSTRNLQLSTAISGRNASDQRHP
jgi:hypothetical protein